MIKIYVEGSHMNTNSTDTVIIKMINLDNSPAISMENSIFL